MENPLVSVIIPTYNGEKSIVKALESVQQQTYKNLEIIVINDASFDNTSQIVLAMAKQDARIKAIQHEKNCGFVKSLNSGLAASGGTYIARLDDDDIWADKQKIEKQVSFLEHHKDYALVGGGLIKIDAKGKEVVRYLFPGSDGDIRKTILSSNPFAHSAVVFKKSVAEELGGYDEQFGFFSDRALWLAIGKVAKFYNFPEYFVAYLDKEIGNDAYQGRNLQIRRKLWLNIILRFRYRHDYPGFVQSIFLCLCSFGYSFVPFKTTIWPVMFKIRVALFGKPPYTYK